MNRCPKHIRVRPHNLNAKGEECGACIMQEVWFLHHYQLDLLDTIADLFTAHAQLRTRLSEVESRLAFYERGAAGSPS